jgi:hypothetical protein
MPANQISSALLRQHPYPSSMCAMHSDFAKAMHVVRMPGIAALTHQAHADLLHRI